MGFAGGAETCGGDESGVSAEMMMMMMTEVWGIFQGLRNARRDKSRAAQPVRSFWRVAGSGVSVTARGVMPLAPRKENWTFAVAPAPPAPDRSPAAPACSVNVKVMGTLVGIATNEGEKGAPVLHGVTVKVLLEHANVS